MDTEKNVSPLPELRSLWNYLKPEESERKFRALLPRAKEEENLAYFVELIAHLGRAISLQKKYIEAHEILNKAEPFVTDKMSVAAIQYYLERGRVYFWQKEKEKAYKLFIKALDIAREKEEDLLALDIIHMLAALPEKPEDRLPWHLKALDFLENTSCQKAKQWSATLHSNAGGNYYELGEYNKALQLYKKALEYRKLQKSHIGIFQAKFALARTYRHTKDVETALEIQKNLIDEIENGMDQPIGHIKLEIAECLLLMGENEKAKPFFSEAYAFFCNFEWKQSQNFWFSVKQEEIDRMKKLGEVEN